MWLCLNKYTYCGVFLFLIRSFRLSVSLSQSCPLCNQTVALPATNDYCTATITRPK